MTKHRLTPPTTKGRVTGFRVRPQPHAVAVFDVVAASQGEAAWTCVQPAPSVLPPTSVMEATAERAEAQSVGWPDGKGNQ